MPCISRFCGMSIYMYPSEHAPPHFHVRSAGAEAQVSLATGDVIAGRLSIRQARLVKQWWRRYKSEISENWNRLTAGHAPRRIQGLE